MSLDKSDVARIAHLARLGLDDADVEELAGELSRILDFIAQMDVVDTAGITPLAHPLDISARLRTDVVTEADQRDRFQSIAPATANGLYLVPKVIE